MQYIPQVNLPVRCFELGDRACTAIVDDITEQTLVYEGVIIGYQYQDQRWMEGGDIFVCQTGWIYSVLIVQGSPQQAKPDLFLNHLHEQELKLVKS